MISYARRVRRDPAEEEEEMASYSMEDIELIRRRSGMSYEEAIALLDYHDGSVARALVDLERNGRLKEEEKKMETTMKKTLRAINSQVTA